MMDKIKNFIKYNNGFVFIVAAVFLVAGSTFAMTNDGVQNGVAEIIGKKTIVEQGIDNKAILAIDFNNFNSAAKINNVSEDEENYYLDYEYKTFDIIDNKWQEVLKKNKLTIAKIVIERDLLAPYAIKQIEEVTTANLAELKIIQIQEQAKGKTEIVKSEEYSGLLGLIMDVKDRAVNQEPEVEIAPVLPVVEDIQATDEGLIDLTAELLNNSTTEQSNNDSGMTSNNQFDSGTSTESININNNTLTPDNSTENSVDVPSTPVVGE